jgi:Ca2+-binding protein (EF-Hand superfamily)
MANELQLEQLFRACDKQGTGHIGPSEFRDLCAGFDIDHSDSDAIFTDLDHDGDGQVSLEDFAWGFRDFLTPGSRRSSVQVSAGSDVTGIYVNNEEAVKHQVETERRHENARIAWSHLVAGVGEANVHKFLSTR